MPLDPNEELSRIARGAANLDFFDQFINSSEDEAPDADGLLRPTLSGLYNNFAFYGPVPYMAGISIGDHRTLVTYLGQVYSPVPAEVPFVTPAVFDVSQWQRPFFVDEAEAARDAAEAAETNIVALVAGVQSVADEVAEAQAARDVAVAAQGGAEGARDTAIAARDAAQTARDDAETAETNAQAIADGVAVVARNAQTGTAYTLADADKGTVVTMDNAGPNTVTIPANATSAISVGAMITVLQVNDGPTTIQAEAGVTLNGVDGGSGDIGEAIKGTTLWQMSADTWVAMGFIGDVT
jgi:hypothetical protein